MMFTPSKILVLTALIFYQSTLTALPQQHQIERKESKRTSFKKIIAGDSLYAIMKKEGFSPSEINQILRIDLPFKDMTLSQGQIYQVSQVQQRKQIKFYQLPSSQTLTLWRDDKRAGAHFKEDDFLIQVTESQGIVNGSILSSIEKASGSLQIAYRFLDAFAFDFDLQSRVQKGAPFELRFERKYDGDYFVGFGELLEASIVIQDEQHQRSFLKFPVGGGSFINPLVAQTDRPFFSPVNYIKISSGFNPRRQHPITKKRTPHYGVDFELDTGEPVLSIAEGEVLRMGKNRAAGLYLVIAHDDGFESYYNHLSQIDPSVKQGDLVFSGQKIGEIGCTGYCTKPHLHFALKRAGRYLDPIKYIRSYPYHSKDLVAQFVEEKQLL